MALLHSAFPPLGYSLCHILDNSLTCHHHIHAQPNSVNVTRLAGGGRLICSYCPLFYSLGPFLNYMAARYRAKQRCATALCSAWLPVTQLFM